MAQSKHFLLFNFYLKHIDIMTHCRHPLHGIQLGYFGYSSRTIKTTVNYTGGQYTYLICTQRRVDLVPILHF
jgi:hypothetical protein